MVTEEILLEHWRKLNPEKQQILGGGEQLKSDSEITSLESDFCATHPSAKKLWSIPQWAIADKY